LRVVNLVGTLPLVPSNGLRFRDLSAIELVAVHWDGGPMIREGYDPPAYYRAEALYHISKNWAKPGEPVAYGSGIMYHDKVSRDGTVYHVREAEEIVWHATDANDIAYAICVDATDGQPPTAVQLASLLKLLEKRRGELKVTRGQVQGHGELTAYGNVTFCPGLDLERFLTQYRAGVL
jgi:hypothetical protein